MANVHLFVSFTIISHGSTFQCLPNWDIKISTPPRRSETDVIEATVLINLKRRADKYFYALGALRALDFPFVKATIDNPGGKHITRFNAHDGLDYPSLDAIVDAAVADGFPHLVHLVDSFTKAENGIERTVFASNWSIVSALRYICELDKPVLLLLDDMLPTFRWPYRRIERLAVEALHLRPSFRALQLGIFINNFRQTQEYEYKIATSQFAPGFISGFNGGFYLAPEGAQFLYDLYVNPPHKRSILKIEHVTRHSLKRPEFSEGLWRVVEPVIEPLWVYDSDRKLKRRK